MPGVDGPAIESLIACQPSAALTCSDSKRSSRYWVAEVAKRKRRLVDPGAVARPPGRRASQRRDVAGRRARGFGGVVSISGVTSSASSREVVLELRAAPAASAAREPRDRAPARGEVVVEQQRAPSGKT